MNVESRVLLCCVKPTGVTVDPRDIEIVMQGVDILG